MLDTTIHGGTNISKTLEVLLNSLGPLGREVRTLGLLIIEVADGELLADVALQIDVGPSRATLLLHADEVDAEAALTELLLEVNIGHLRNGLDEDLDSVLEVVKVTLVRSLGEKSPSLVLGLVGDVVHGDLHLVLAVESVMTLLLAVLANLGLGRTVASLVALLAAFAASTSELAGLGAVGLGVTLFALDVVSQASRGRAVRSYAVEAGTHLLGLRAVTSEVALCGLLVVLKLC